MERRLIKYNYTENKDFCDLKDTISKVKTLATDWGKAFAGHINKKYVN